MRDLVIVGSGSAGVAAAIEASQGGADVAVIERGTLGGTCVNVGCVPSKTLLRAAESYHLARHSRFQGVRPAGASADLAAIIAQKDALVRELRQHKYADVLESVAVPLLQGHARFAPGGQLTLDGEPLAARRVLIATGAEAVLPPIPGLADVQPWTYVEALSPSELPATLVVIGAGAIGLELAQAYARLGSRVTVLEALSRALPNEDEQLSAALQAYLADENVEIVTGARVTMVSRQDGAYHVAVTLGGEQRILEGHRLLVATGRAPRTRDLDLANAGIELTPTGAIEVSATLATSNPSVYAAGDVAGLPQFVYAAAQAGRVAARNALGDEGSLDLSALPRVTFTDPAVAAVGLTEREARASHGDGVRISVLPMDQVPRALAAFDTRGLVKLVTAADGTLLGAHILAPEAGDVLQEAIIAVKYELNYRDLIDTFHPYLTNAEALRLAAQALDTDVAQLSCCA